MIRNLLRCISLLATGLLAGAFFYAFLNVVPTFYEVPLQVHLVFRTTLMQHNGIVMPVTMLAAIITSAGYGLALPFHQKGLRVFSFLAALLALTALLITFFGNVPINGMIKTWNPEYPPADWRGLLKQWDRFHMLRTVAAVGSFGCVVLSSLAAPAALKS